MADVTITVTDGATTPTGITISDAAVKVAADALCVAVGITPGNPDQANRQPPNDVRAIRKALARHIRTTIKRHRINETDRDYEAQKRAAIDLIEAEPDAGDGD